MQREPFICVCIGTLDSFILLAATVGQQYKMNVLLPFNGNSRYANAPHDITFTYIVYFPIAVIGALEISKFIGTFCVNFLAFFVFFVFVVFLDAFAIYRNVTFSFVMSVCLSLRYSAWNNSTPTRRIFINPSAWGHLNPSSYCDVGRLFYGVFKLWSKLQREKK